MQKIFNNRYHGWPHLLWICMCLMGIYYITDSSMDALLFDEGTVLQQIFSPDTHELAIRLLSGTFLLTFFLFAKHLFTKNHQLQQRLLQNSQDLNAANQEREAFTYVFTHEMRTNLALISAAEQRLSDKDSHRLSTEGGVQVRQIQESCKKMSAQISAVLELSQAISAKLDYQQVSLNHLVHEVAQEIISEVNDITVSIETEKNINLACDPDLIRLVIKTLCMNVVNFCRPNRCAEISIGAETCNGAQTFFVRRSCMNIDQKEGHLSTLLKRATESPENHAGLTSVQTIIERHGGKLWTDNSNKIGSAFYFTL